ncbi:MAG: hypothetical protein M5U34_12900 [Chloroflexi bacterium]|nr:hypothetical protein [Chloroflexota bacterium]
MRKSFRINWNAGKTAVRAASATQQLLDGRSHTKTTCPSQDTPLFQHEDSKLTSQHVKHGSLCPYAWLSF